MVKKLDGFHVSDGTISSLCNVSTMNCERAEPPGEGPIDTLMTLGTMRRAGAAGPQFPALPV